MSGTYRGNGMESESGGVRNDLGGKVRGPVFQGGRFEKIVIGGKVRRVNLGALLLVVELIMLVGALALWPDGPWTQYIGFYVCCGAAFSAAVAFVIVSTGSGTGTGTGTGIGASTGAGAGAGSERKAVPWVMKGWVRALRVAALPALAAVSVLSCVAGLVVFLDVVDTGEIPAQISVKGDRLLTGSNPALLTLEMAAPEHPRKRLRLALSIVDDDSATGTCVHKTKATIEPVTQNVTPEHKVAADSTVDFDLGGRQDTVQFLLTVTTDANSRCRMRLEKALGTLHG
ncbi:hypothetical protein [Streptomyces sp. NBC_00878]|uniref:hypothetical protein n=1 Tax=Streptomyces sp. NBC_00878 TaxID=2975854 RepID=UPI0022528DEF|nr:hypothetical protein [Streptomyces sp. NBC_00878]MCX4906579.1 hypothetical protein [Streptomyces sp. NBC_00878]